MALVDVGLQGGAEVALDEILSASPAPACSPARGCRTTTPSPGCCARARAAPWCAMRRPRSSPPRCAAPARGRRRSRRGKRPRAAQRAARPDARDEPRPRGARSQARSNPVGDGARRARHRLPADRRARLPRGRGLRGAVALRRPSPKRGPAQWFAEAHEVGLGVELELFAVRMACERSQPAAAGRLHGRQRLAGHGRAARSCSSCSTARTWTTWSSR